MQEFEFGLVLMLGAVLLAGLARRIGIPYPALLAVGGAALAFAPGAPAVVLPADLILAVFVAPVLIEAAYGVSLRDLQDNWRPVTTLVTVAVLVTTATVAWAAHELVPGMPWAAAIALGAIVAPPDAAAATAVLRALKPPHRVMVILEGESLFNDATALLIYRFAVAAAMTGQFSAIKAVPTFLAVAFGSAMAGWGAARLFLITLGRVDDVPSKVILQFIAGFGLWLIADRVGLSGVVTVVVFGITLARFGPEALDPRERIHSVAVWQTMAFLLNVGAFTLIGLQTRTLFGALHSAERTELFEAVGLVVLTVVVVRVVWVMGYNRIQALKNRMFGVNLAREKMMVPTSGTGLVVAWAGMRGTVTVAAALALPAHFPNREFIILCAFAVTIVTLVVLGPTLAPLLKALDLPPDDLVQHEAGYARAEGLKAALAELEGEEGTAVRLLRREYQDALGLTEDAEGDRPDTELNALRRRAIGASRRRIIELRAAGEIGDDAFRVLEEEYDLIELASRDPAEEQAAGPLEQPVPAAA